MNDLQFLFKAIPWLGLFAAITLSWIFYLRARNKERLALIEKGVDVEKILPMHNGANKSKWLKLGIVIFSISLGILLAYLIGALTYDGSMGFPLLFLMIPFGLLFGGIGMIIASKIESKSQQKKG